jgi:DNA-binding transcriptional LysR family regulator
MDVELRHLRSFVEVIDTGTFTDAGIQLGISQTAVSRNVAALEAALGVRLLHRTTRSTELTPAGERVIRYARRALMVISDLRQEASACTDTVRMGYAWSALGRHTPELQHRWAVQFPHLELRLIRSNTPTAGLSDGTSDLSILRRTPDLAALDVELIGSEKRYCAMSVEDPLAGKRSVTLTEIATRPVAIDQRTGSTRLDLWPEGKQPQKTINTDDVDDWLTVIGSGKARGITAESTTHQYRRQGVVYRPVRDATPVPVYAAWLKTDPPQALEDAIALLRDIYGQQSHGTGSSGT